MLGLKSTLGLAAICAVFSAFSAFNIYKFDDIKKEKQFTALIDELRCPKCQNNNLSDSNAPLATDIKNYVYQSIKSGKSSDEISDFLISRYGNFVTYRPRNWVIWALPTIVGFFALFIILYRLMRCSEITSETGVESVDMATIIKDYKKEQEKR